MNLALLDPQIRNALPEHIEEQLDDGIATCCKFNRRGTLLAVGCNDGRCVIYDFDTHGIAKVLIGHVHPISSVSWSRNGRTLLSSSTDWNLLLWDVLASTPILTVKFESPILTSLMHPRGQDIALVCPLMEHPVLVNLKTGEKTRLPTKEKEGETPTRVPRRVATNSVAAFNCKGDWIYVGNSKGVITILDTQTHKVISTFKIPGGAVKSIHFSKDKKQYLVNSTDKVIRMYNCADNTLVHELSDVVNKIQWKKCCFSGDDDHIIAGSAQKAEHKNYIWSREFGQLVKILEGPKEGVMDLEWHPTRPIVVSCSTTGMAYIWNAHYTENWSAFAPGFTELEENLEYIEKEDEFDIVDEETEANKKKKKQEAEDVIVDIITVEKTSGDLSSDEEDELFFFAHLPNG